MSLTFTETIRGQQLKLLADNPTIQPQQRRKYLVQHCPFADPVKVRAWKEMAKSLTSERPVIRTFEGMSPEEAEWRRKNQI